MQGGTETEKPHFPRREREAHKGAFGKVFLLSGSRGYTGAPCLAAKAAVRSGAGLVTVGVPEDVYPIVAVKCCDEAMVWPLSEVYGELLKKAKDADAVLIGPGLGQGEKAEEYTLNLLRDITCPVILDADGLNIISRHIDVLDKRRALTVLTPHEGEFARLTDCQIPIRDRHTEAEAFARKHGCILVLKGHRTITALPDGRCYINRTGNPGMARGGSGDALAGLMVGLLGQRLWDPVRAVISAVWLHGRAGDLAAAEKGEYGMAVSDMIEMIPCAIKECEEE